MDEEYYNQELKHSISFLIKRLRDSVRYRIGGKETEYEAGFFQGWVTACSVMLSFLGKDPKI